MARKLTPQQSGKVGALVRKGLPRKVARRIASPRPKK